MATNLHHARWTNLRTCHGCTVRTARSLCNGSGPQGGVLRCTDEGYASRDASVTERKYPVNIYDPIRKSQSDWNRRWTDLFRVQYCGMYKELTSTLEGLGYKRNLTTRVHSQMNNGLLHRILVCIDDLFLASHCEDSPKTIAVTSRKWQFPSDAVTSRLGSAFSLLGRIRIIMSCWARLAQNPQGLQQDRISLTDYGRLHKLSTMWRRSAALLRQTSCFFLHQTAHHLYWERRKCSDHALWPSISGEESETTGLDCSFLMWDKSC